MALQPTRLLSKALLGSVRPLYFVARRARVAAGTQRGARYVEGLGSRAHYNDVLLASTLTRDVVRYRRSAVAFVDILAQGLDDAGRSWASVRACLDASCGYGRIIRELSYDLPLDAISVCDTADEGSAFTAAEFGVRRLPSVEKLGRQFEDAFDLVYALSLYTRLDRARLEAHLAKVATILRPGGVLVFTTLGPTAARDAELGAKARLAFERNGFFHARYGGDLAGSGLTLIAPDELARLVATVASPLALVSYRAATVESREDVFVYRKP